MTESTDHHRTSVMQNVGVNGELRDLQDDNGNIRPLVFAHQALAKIVAPATPQAILLFERISETSGAWNAFGSVPIVRQFMLLTVLALVLFICMALFPNVTGDISFYGADSWSIFLNLLFLLSASALGAAFGALFQISRFVSEVSYDPRYNSSYWIKITLGLVSSVIITQLVPIGEIDGRNPNQAAALDFERIAKPTLALLGGFSATVVLRILNRLVATAETLVRGEAREIINAHDIAMRARISEQQTQIQAHMILRLLRLRQQVHEGAGSEVLQSRIAEMLEDVGALDITEPTSTGRREAG